MAAYAEFCDKESSEKGYTIKTAVRKIGDLEATIEDCSTKIPAYEDEVSTLGSEVAAKTKQLYEASEVRKGQKADFGKVEKELMTSIDQLERAVTIIKRETGAGASFIQGSSKSMQNLNTAIKALGKIIDSTRISFSARKSLKSLLQTGNLGGEDNYESLRQPQAKEVAYDSKSEEMKEKAEETLTDARNTEMKAQQDYSMLEQSLNNGIAVGQEKISVAKKSVGMKTEEKGSAEGDLGETSAAKAADEKYVAQLKHDCEEAAANWAQRQESASAETGAINKAIEVLSEGVRVLLQKNSIVSKKQVNDNLAKDDQEFDDDAPPSADAAESQSRMKLVNKLKSLSQKFGSYALMEMAGSAAMDPFVKIKGLIEEMIAKLVQEAQEEATQKAFCDEEMGKSKKAAAEKGLTLDKLQSRLDQASARKAELELSIKELEGEIATLDAGTAEATKLRNEEHTTYLKSSKDFADAATATEKAIKVLKEYYDSAALIQTGAKSVSKQPEFGAAKSEAGGVIISILEMSNEDFTKLHSECEASEAEAQEAYEKLMNENKASKAAKEAEAKAAASEIKSLTVTLENTGEDHSMTSKELAAVMDYVEKLKPQCEEKAMSYAEKKARREAEISGLKEALEILAGDSVFLQKNLRVAKRHA